MRWPVGEWAGLHAHKGDVRLYMHKEVVAASHGEKRTYGKEEKNPLPKKMRTVLARGERPTCLQRAEGVELIVNLSWEQGEGRGLSMTAQKMCLARQLQVVQRAVVTQWESGRFGPRRKERKKRVDLFAVVDIH